MDQRLQQEEHDTLSLLYKYPTGIKLTNVTPVSHDAQNYCELEVQATQELYDTTAFKKKGRKFHPESYSPLKLPSKRRVQYDNTDHSRNVKESTDSFTPPDFSSYSHVQQPTAERYQTTCHKPKRKKKISIPLPHEHNPTDTYSQLHIVSSKENS